MIPYFYPAWRFGGPVRVAYDVSRKLVERGHSVTVYTSDILEENTRVGAFYRNVEGVDVYYFRNLSLHAARRKMYVIPSLIFAVKDSAKFFDIVHIHGNRTTLSPMLHYFLKKNSVPYVVQAHGGLPSVGRHRLKRLYDLVFGYPLLRDASKVIALTRTEVQQYLSMGVPAEKIAIVPNGIDLTEYSDLPSKGAFKRKFNIQENTKIILYLGRIHRTKGIDLLIKAYAYMIKTMKCKNTLLVIAGPDDGYLAESKSLVSSLGISDLVLFTGFINSTDKLAAFVDADVFVTPSFYGFPVTFLEACAVGVPIATTTTGDTLDWINKNVGYVTSPTIDDLSKAIGTIILDADLHIEFSMNCNKLVKSEFSLETVVDKLEQVYAQVITNRLAQFSN
jgi:glycosyltransferase involved in cell wall biosynthesis